MQSHNFVPASARQAVRHYLGSDVPSTGLVHTSFRVQIHEVPRWLHKNNAGGGRDPVEGYTGVGYDFTYTRYNRETGEAYKYTGHLHSASIDKQSFAERTLADAYWQVVETQKGRRAVITFWWCDKGGSVQPDTAKHDTALRSLFGELADTVWDYMEMYDNPESAKLNCDANLALVFKGASKGKPVQHLVGIDEQPIDFDVTLHEDALDPVKGPMVAELLAREEERSTRPSGRDMAGIVADIMGLEQPSASEIATFGESATTALGEQLEKVFGKK